MRHAVVGVSRTDPFSISVQCTFTGDGVSSRGITAVVWGQSPSLSGRFSIIDTSLFAAQ